MKDRDTAGAEMNREFAAYTRELTAEVGSDIEKLFSGQIDRARDFDIEKLGLSTGDRAPNFRLPGTDGVPVELKGLLRQGPVVLIFYRGGWCPYCNIQLRAYQRALPQFEELRAQVVAVSPETVGHSEATQQSESLGFHLLSDNDNGAARAFGLTFRISPEVETMFEAWELDLEERNGVAGAEVPVPATYVIDEGCRILFGQPDVDFRRRVEPEKVLEVLRSR